MESSSRKSNKIRDIVRLHQILKKWKKIANTNTNTRKTSSNCTDAAAACATNSTLSGSGGSRSIKFLKKTLSFSESSNSLGSAVPKGYIAVSVGKEEKRFVIPTEYLSHQVFGILLREAEEEFGFQQQGVLKLPCEVDLFNKILKMMEDDKNTTLPKAFLLLDQDEFESDSSTYPTTSTATNNCSPDTGLTATPHQHHSQSQMCR